MYDYFYKFQEFFINDQSETVITNESNSLNYNTLGECFEDSFYQEVIRNYGDKEISIEKLNNINLQQIAPDQYEFYNHVYSYKDNEKKMYLSFNYYQTKKQQAL